MKQQGNTSSTQKKAAEKTVRYEHMKRVVKKQTTQVYQKQLTIDKNGRVLSSPIEGLTISEVRVLLTEARVHWANHLSRKSVFSLCTKLSNGMSIEEFAFKYVCGKYDKRTEKHIMTQQ